MVQKIIQKFDDLFKVLDTFDKENIYDYGRYAPHKGNVRVAIDTWTEIADLWAREREELRTWLTDYFTENKQAIYDKFYMDAAEKLIKDNLNHYWQFKEADADFIAHCPDLGQWRMSEELVRASRARMNFRQCDDQEILHRHDDIPCNEGFVCLLHEEMEWDWCAKVEAELRQTDNIFLNVASRQAFIGRPVASWTGPAKSPISLRPFESIDGKTPFQAMRSLIASSWDLRSTFRVSSKTEYEHFISLWFKADFIDERLFDFMRQVAFIKNTL